MSVSKDNLLDFLGEYIHFLYYTHMTGSPPTELFLSGPKAPPPQVINALPLAKFKQFEEARDAEVMYAHAYNVFADFKANKGSALNSFQGWIASYKNKGNLSALNVLTNTGVVRKDASRRLIKAILYDHRLTVADYEAYNKRQIGIGISDIEEVKGWFKGGLDKLLDKFNTQKYQNNFVIDKKKFLKDAGYAEALTQYEQAIHAKRGAATATEKLIASDIKSLRSRRSTGTTAKEITAQHFSQAAHDNMAEGAEKVAHGLMMGAGKLIGGIGNFARGKKGVAAAGSGGIPGTPLNTAAPNASPSSTAPITTSNGIQVEVEPSSGKVAISIKKTEDEIETGDDDAAKIETVDEQKEADEKQLSELEDINKNLTAVVAATTEVGDKVSEIESSNGLGIGGLGDMLKDVLGKGLISRLGGLLAGASSLALPAAAVAAAGAGGYAIGTGINKAVEWATDGKASIGTMLYDVTHREQANITPESGKGLYEKNLKKAKSTQSAKVEKATEEIKPSQVQPNVEPSAVATPQSAKVEKATEEIKPSQVQPNVEPSAVATPQSAKVEKATEEIDGMKVTYTAEETTRLNEIKAELKTADIRKRRDLREEESQISDAAKSRVKPTTTTETPTVKPAKVEKIPADIKYKLGDDFIQLTKEEAAENASLAKDDIEGAAAFEEKLKKRVYKNAKVDSTQLPSPPATQIKSAKIEKSKESNESFELGDNYGKVKLTADEIKMKGSMDELDFIQKVRTRVDSQKKGVEPNPKTPADSLGATEKQLDEVEAKKEAAKQEAAKQAVKEGAKEGVTIASQGGNSTTNNVMGSGGNKNLNIVSRGTNPMDEKMGRKNTSPLPKGRY